MTSSSSEMATIVETVETDVSSTISKEEETSEDKDEMEFLEKVKSIKDIEEDLTYFVCELWTHNHVICETLDRLPMSRLHSRLKELHLKFGRGELVQLGGESDGDTSASTDDDAGDAPPPWATACKWGRRCTAHQWRSPTKRGQHVLQYWHPQC